MDTRREISYVIEHRREIFRGEPTVEQVLAFLAGFDVAWGFSLLRGFSEWLTVEHGVSDAGNIHWFGLASSLAFERGPWDEPRECSEVVDRAAALRLLHLVLAFLETVEEPARRRQMYAAYELLVHK